MNFGNLGFTELLMILVIVLVLFGARRCPRSERPSGRAFASSRRTSATSTAKFASRSAIRARPTASAPATRP